MLTKKLYLEKRYTEELSAYKLFVGTRLANVLARRDGEAESGIAEGEKCNPFTY